jgi:hypothetical protein
MNGINPVPACDTVVLVTLHHDPENTAVRYFRVKVNSKRRTDDGKAGVLGALGRVYPGGRCPRTGFELKTVGEIRKAIEAVAYETAEHCGEQFNDSFEPIAIAKAALESFDRLCKEMADGTAVTFTGGVAHGYGDS